MHTLSTHLLVGRSSACTVRIEDARVSGEHARLSWHGERWRVRDLGSRNGTLVNGVALARGGTADLAEGDAVAFGGASLRFVLMDASAPSALARRPGSGEIRQARDGMVVLPSEDEPVACILERDDGTWAVEIEGEVREARDGEILEILGAAWVLHLPVTTAPTADAAGARPDEPASALRFRVSRDEERIEVLVETPNGTRALSPRAHHYTLLTLARARGAAEQVRDLPEPARGWINVDDLCRMLAVDEMRLNVEIYRIRRDFTALGLQNAATLIERRRSSRQVRLALPAVRIEPLG
ncbi:FHA domain-containing protein [Sorangium sp. So ce1000]|uniref:FHA domain-containing protein n=1 Tax=Sorangium sp. So ce1000 TaxID=3133325 RepID=UPI003F5F1C62